MERGLIEKILSRLNKDVLKRGVHYLARKSFRFWEKYFDLHIGPANFYSPIPMTNELDASVFEKIYDCVGIDWNLKEQTTYLQEVFPKYREEYKPSVNSGLSLVDAYVLYVMIRENKPKVMIEVGSGDTTFISLEAIRMNRKEGNSCKFYAIEPYPRQYLREVQDESFELVESKLQDVNLDLMSSADLLFIDSSHVSKINSDVNCEILEIIPKLKVGTLIHWHDIVMPTNYWKEWINDGNMFWNESYMVHSFMLFNAAYKIVWAARYMNLNCSDELQLSFPYLQKNHRLMSFWIERVK